MYVIVDWHILSDGNPNSHKKEAKAFFKEMSKELKGYNNVIYEICNEPNNGTSWKEIKSYAKRVISTIRENDKKKRKVQQTLEFTGLFWRRGWDSNPCAIARKLISSQPRYDHFDTSPCMSNTVRTP